MASKEEELIHSFCGLLREGHMHYVLNTPLDQRIREERAAQEKLHKLARKLEAQLAAKKEQQ